MRPIFLYTRAVLYYIWKSQWNHDLRDETKTRVSSQRSRAMRSVFSGGLEEDIDAQRRQPKYSRSIQTHKSIESSLSNIHHEAPGGCGVSFLILPFQGRGGEQLAGRSSTPALTRPMSTTISDHHLTQTCTSQTTPHLRPRTSAIAASVSANEPALRVGSVVACRSRQSLCVCMIIRSDQESS